MASAVNLSAVSDFRPKLCHGHKGDAAFRAGYRIIGRFETSRVPPVLTSPDRRHFGVFLQADQLNRRPELAGTF